MFKRIRFRKNCKLILISLMHINIADLAIYINNETYSTNKFKWLNGFKSKIESIDININLIIGDCLKQFDEKVYSEEGFCWWLDNLGYGVTINNRSNKTLAILSASNSWNYIVIEYIKESTARIIKTLMEIAFRNVLYFHNGLILHASAISFKDKGFVFSAPSGTGKSTQADLWVKHKGAKIMNGDRPAIRVFDNEVRVYGTPWSGTSNQHLNMSAPLEAIFLLEQSPFNEVLSLSTQEALQRITARCYLPYFDEKLMGLALDNIGTVIQKTPVYLLKCRADSGAVDVVASCLGL